MDRETIQRIIPEIEATLGRPLTPAQKNLVISLLEQYDGSRDLEEIFKDALAGGEEDGESKILEKLEDTGKEAINMGLTLENLEEFKNNSALVLGQTREEYDAKYNEYLDIYLKGANNH